MHVSHEWLQHLERGSEVGAVFFDFKKTFDTVPSSLALTIYARKDRSGPHVVLWIQNYLAERRQRVVIGGTSSGSSRVLSEVPEGSILGPLLFLIYA